MNGGTIQITIGYVWRTVFHTLNATQFPRGSLHGIPCNTILLLLMKLDKEFHLLIVSLLVCISVKMSLII